MIQVLVITVRWSPTRQPRREHQTTPPTSMFPSHSHRPTSAQRRTKAVRWAALHWPFRRTPPSVQPDPIVSPSCSMASAPAGRWVRAWAGPKKKNSNVRTFICYFSALTSPAMTHPITCVVPRRLQLPTALHREERRVLFRLATATPYILGQALPLVPACTRSCLPGR